MDLDQRRRWELLAQRFRELLKRLESGTFPNREDWTLVLLIGTIAEELGRPRPVRMEVEQVWPVLNEGMRDPRGPVREFLVLRSFGPNPSKSSTGPTVSVSISRDEPTSYPVRGLPLRESAFHFVQRGDDPPVESLFTWDRELRDVATFLAGTWLLTIELALPIEPKHRVELSGRARRAVELLAKHPEGMMGKQIANALAGKKLPEGSDKNISRDLADAIAKGLVENAHDGNGYRLTVLGRAWAEENLPRSTASDGSATVSDGSRRKRDGTPKAR